MSFDVSLGALNAATIKATITKGLMVELPDGRVGQLAIVDPDGVVIEAGETVAQGAWHVSIASYREYRRGLGHLVVHTVPPAAARREVAA